MKMFYKKSLLTLMCSTALLLSACNDDDDKDEYSSGKTYQSELNYSQDTLAEASSIKVMTYLMPNVQGKNAKATAMVMFPKTPKPENGWRVVIWAHGTTGIGDSCAPSNNPFNERFEILANSLLKEGYVVVAPDYEGLGTSGIHPYLNLSSAAKSATYAVDAVQEKYGKDLNKSWMSIGQSQGGHASLAIAEFANANADYKGAVATAPASSLGYIITQVAPLAIAQIAAGEKTGAYPPGASIAVYSELLAYAAYTGVGIRAYDPQFNLSTIFEDGAKLIAEKAEGTTGDNGQCLQPLMNEFMTDIGTFLAKNTDKTILDYPGLKDGFEKDPVVAKFLVDNQPATKKLNKPLYVVQGQLDTAVPYQVTQGLVQQLNALGTTPPAILDIVEGAGHTQAIVQKNTEVVAFVKKHMPAR
ncbi:alpha/beta hydrolase [Acinetobacter sp. TGL-Y2]|uniref:alpha/beta hydrolase family protein n=1 Tax=Acinetobacter sp. TGL-Y2 TaxID=1407071 RepID=UPI0007A6684E|nr:alpha/beta hydrolase [Acinetobacter sp. TGL-Y2]AMW79405.1 alpha/beta hydrolase [Acinetobacter sp. TGL-Y2]